MTPMLGRSDIQITGKWWDMYITREKFIEVVGREPTHDDLERCNCHNAGTIGHLYCGWNPHLNKPQFEIGPQAWNGKFPTSS